MNPWRQFPLVRLILPVCTGMAAGIFSEQEIKVPLVFPGLLLLCFSVIVFSHKFIFPYALRWITGILIILITTLLSYSISLTGKDTLRKDYFGNFEPGQRTCIGEVTEPVIQKQKSTKTIIRIICMKERGTWCRTDGMSLVYFGKSLRSQLLCYGDRLVMTTRFTLPQVARNPGGFDNRRYLRLKGIYRQAYVNPDHWRLISRGRGNPLFRMALCWRDRMLMILRNNGLKGREFAVAGALLLGYVDEIDSDLMRDYSATGVMHILSVSGMHVGMIFLVLERLLSFLSGRKNGASIRAVLVIVFIWVYALITGLSPAVMRAAAMLSLVVAGKTMKRHPDILNILAASVIFLLAWQPVLLADPGFQLSYLAVAGIVLFYKPVYDLFVPGNWLLEKVWSIVAVSMAAQLVTLPLCLYYFHQFPNYFFITNILVIPLSNLIIYTGILCLAVGSVPVISLVAAKALSLMVWFLNAFIHWMGSLPFSVTHGIVITFPESILLYMILVTCAVYISGKNKVWLFAMLSLMILLSGNVLMERWHQAAASTITVYDVRGPGLYDFTAGGKSILVGGLSALNDPFFSETMMKYRQINKISGLFEFQHPLPSRKGYSAFQSDGFYRKGNYIGFSGKKIGIVNRVFRGNRSCKMKVDYLIISGGPKTTLKEVIKYFNPGMVIFDASNSLWKVKEWMKEAHWLGLRCHSVSVSGAFREEF
ncbi:MAG: ComEC/Rec2 family competence protein [Bacteroidetes bacterium]|nr:ComEC/Rec2 family competence protein [Bacteroidota bacterium]